jgi:hypothetical protein
VPLQNNNALQTVSAFGMNQSDVNLFHDGHREVIAAKAGFQGQAVHCSSPSRPEEFQDSLEHDAWSPNTPTMTRGSSRSTSSTIIACETCGNSSNQCGCQSQSDSESVRFHGAETEYVQFFESRLIWRTLYPSYGGNFLSMIIC